MKHLLVALLFLPLAAPLRAEPAAPAPVPSAASPADYILLTVILRQDQSKNLDDLNREMEASGFWREFPPAGIEVESWNVAMGLGQVVVLRVPPARLREVNLCIEKRVWKTYHTEIYPTYDLREVVRARRQAAPAKN